MMMLIAIPHLISSRARSTTLPPARYSAPGRLESPLSVGWAKAHKRQVKGGIRRPLGSVIARLDRSRVAFSRYHRARPAKNNSRRFSNVGKGSSPALLIRAAVRQVYLNKRTGSTSHLEQSRTSMIAKQIGITD